MPAVGLYGETMKRRGFPIGGPISGPWRLVFLGTKGDRKERMKLHGFTRNYLSTRICELCLAEKRSKCGDPIMNFAHFYSGAMWRDMLVSHDDYVRMSAENVSPWNAFPDWNIHQDPEDIMHNLYSGHGKDLVTSVVLTLEMDGVLRGSTREDRLEHLTLDQES